MTDRRLTFHDDDGDCTECTLLVVLFLAALGIAWWMLAPRIAILIGG